MKPLSVTLIYEHIENERRRQERLRHEGRFTYTLATPNGLTDGQKLACIMEELGEVATETLGSLVQDASGNLRAELIQVAALAVAWVEAIDGATR